MVTIHSPNPRIAKLLAVLKECKPSVREVILKNTLEHRLQMLYDYFNLEGDKRTIEQLLKRIHKCNCYDPTIAERYRKMEPTYHLKPRD